MLLDLLRDNLTFIIISVSVILVIILGYVLLVRPKSYVKEKKDKQPDVYIETESHEEETVEELKAFNTPERNEVVNSNPIHHSEEHIKTADQLMQQLEKQKEEVTYVSEDLPKREPKMNPAVHTEIDSDDEQAKYHVIFREKDGMWYVKRENSKRTLRVLHTKKEAIAYATIKAINQDSNIVIHGEDGKIEKHGY